MDTQVAQIGRAMGKEKSVGTRDVEEQDSGSWTLGAVLSSQTELTSNSQADESEIQAEPSDWPWEVHGAPGQEGGLGILSGVTPGGVESRPQVSGVDNHARRAGGLNRVEWHHAAAQVPASWPAGWKADPEAVIQGPSLDYILPLPPARVWSLVPAHTESYLSPAHMAAQLSGRTEALGTGLQGRSWEGPSRTSHP